MAIVSFIRIGADIVSLTSVEVDALFNLYKKIFFKDTQNEIKKGVI